MYRVSERVNCEWLCVGSHSVLIGLVCRSPVPYQRFAIIVSLVTMCSKTSLIQLHMLGVSSIVLSIPPQSKHADMCCTAVSLHLHIAIGRFLCVTVCLYIVTYRVHFNAHIIHRSAAVRNVLLI